MGATAELAARISALAFDALNEPVVTVTKRLIADGVAVALAGTREAAPSIAAEHVRAMGCSEHASVWGFDFRTTAQNAAYLNAISMHVLDFEPMSNPPTHAVSPTVPAAFALGETLQADGRDIVAACAKGFEMQGRILHAANLERGKLKFHTPGVVGVMGATVAAAHLLQLDAAQLANALGIAASRCSGVSANTGSMVKCTHCGNAAASGVDAALLAQRGFTANPAIFEVRAGYVATFFDAGFDYAALLAFGRPFRCVDPGMAIKFYPSKYPTHYAIGAALELRRAIPDISRVTALRIVTPEIDDADRPQPRSGLEGKFSFQYTAAIALLDGAVGIASFTDERRFRADVTALLGKISLMRDATIPRDTRTMRVEIEADLSDGARERAVCTKPPGSWGAPVDPALHAQKMRDCLRVRLAPEQLAPVLAALDRLEQLNAREVGALIARLTVTKSA
ncbi:MAG TPA: MmgE/PrpD family protein [Burkholderiales bacterium]|nr:MmgE/PrpD family protein [Burkholderiales bacterium]